MTKTQKPVRLSDYLGDGRDKLLTRWSLGPDGEVAREGTRRWILGEELDYEWDAYWVEN